MVNPLGLLPGMDGTGDLFRPFIDSLPSNFSPTIVSYPRDRIAGYEELGNYLSDAVPREAPYVVVAESFSGPVAVEHAAKQPSNLEALILIGSFVSNPLPRPFKLLRFFYSSFCRMDFNFEDHHPASTARVR